MGLSKRKRNRIKKRKQTSLFMRRVIKDEQYTLADPNAQKLSEIIRALHDFFPAYTKNGAYISACNAWNAAPRGKKGESATRAILEQALGTSLSTSWPTWLLNTNTGKRLQLDGFSEIESFAFEYQGRQHFDEVPFFLSRREQFELQQERDSLKFTTCTRRNIDLIQVPQFPWPRLSPRKILTWVIGCWVDKHFPNVAQGIRQQAIALWAGEDPLCRSVAARRLR